MKSSKLLPLALIAATLSGTALAECNEPAVAVVIPDGATATKEAMLGAKKAIADLNAAVSAYQGCLDGERDARIAAGGDKLTDADRTKIANEYVVRANSVVDKLQKLADKFNLEVRAYKAKQAPAPAQ
jgi:hypothetical protein